MANQHELISREKQELLDRHAELERQCEEATAQQNLWDNQSSNQPAAAPSGQEQALTSSEAAPVSANQAIGESQQLSNLAAELHRLHAELKDRSAALDAKTAECDAQRATFEQDKQSLESQRAQLEQLRGDLMSQPDAGSSETRRPEASVDHRERMVLEGDDDISESAAETQEVASDVDASEEASSPSHPAKEEITFSRPSEEAPLSTAALLAKYGVNLEDDEEPKAEKPSRRPMPTQPTTSEQPPAISERKDVPPSSVATSAAGHEDVEDYSEYMARLFERRGGKASVPTTRETTRQTEPVSAPVRSSSSPAEQPLRPMRPKSSRPRTELPVTLSALREVANMNARTALNTHVRKEVNTATVRSLVMLLAGLVAVAIFSWRHLAGDWWAFNAVCAAMLGAAIVGVRYIDSLRKLRRMLIPSQDLQSKTPESAS